MSWPFKHLELSEHEGLVELSGQFSLAHSSAFFGLPEGNHQLMIFLVEGKLRLNHSSYMPEGGWLSPPSNGQQAHYDITGKGECSFMLLIGSSFGQMDQICIVNPQMRSKASFAYKVTLNKLI